MLHAAARLHLEAKGPISFWISFWCVFFSIFKAEEGCSSGLVAHHVPQLEKSSPEVLIQKLLEVWHFSRRWLPAVEKELVKTQQAMAGHVETSSHGPNSRLWRKRFRRAV